MTANNIRNQPVYRLDWNEQQRLELFPLTARELARVQKRAEFNRTIGKNDPRWVIDSEAVNITLGHPDYADRQLIESYHTLEGLAQKAFGDNPCYGLLDNHPCLLGKSWNLIVEKASSLDLIAPPDRNAVTVKGKLAIEKRCTLEN